MSDITFITRTNSMGWRWQRKGDCVEACQFVGTFKGENCFKHYPCKPEDVPEELRHELWPDDDSAQTGQKL